MRKFWHIMYWLSIPFVIISGALFIVGAYFAGEQRMNMTAVFVIAGVLLVLSIALPIYANTVGLRPTKAEKERFAKFLGYPADENIDYKAQLDAIRENFKADTSPDKNVFNTGHLPSFMEFMGDFSVMNSGEIYYACVFRCSYALIKGKGGYINDSYPANIVYSADPYYESHPLELNAIAEVVDGKFTTRFPHPVERQGFTVYENIPVDKELTEGREVFVKSIEIQLDQLPLLRLTNRVIPVIAEPEKDLKAAFVIDYKYWTDKFIGDFVNGKQGNKNNW